MVEEHLGFFTAEQFPLDKDWDWAGINVFGDVMGIFFYFAWKELEIMRMITVSCVLGD